MSYKYLAHDENKKKLFSTVYFDQHKYVYKHIFEY